MLITQQPCMLEKKTSTDLESLEFKTFGVCLTIFKNNQILLNKISHRFLAIAKLCRCERAPLLTKDLLL